ncbi:tRNA (N6-isopentenyl adenosine(37)-C2)-methylthiotransferase MiaB [Beduini massiliensis]|uniref:tRNA (N6-isopentenyl adenosine(37)-C2)-methylthiotransferase MiaB n=1 Tax=Beduini massiliensis TaxID=1585974 RepID=UPI00059A9559|nr:tRNA (N6-isopentenyl adenosine(37)-C2)-methylthiotransferase MiaB [Beduini massiliensis]
MEKDYTKYFKGPSLKEAKHRGKEEVKILKDEFVIPDTMKNIGAGKTYYIKTYGCQANERDSETMRGILESMGYQETKEMDQADVVLLNTCAIRENAELKVFGKIGDLKRIKRDRPDMIFGMCGCMAQEEEVIARLLQKHPHTDLIFGTHNIHRLPELLHEAMMSKEMVIEVWSKEGDIVENVPASRENPLKAWVNIMYGCDKFCTYCIVPYTRGKERSRLPKDILHEVEELKASGYKEITLLGQNVNSYGKDFKDAYSFADLMRDVAKTGIDRIRFTTSHPWDFTDEMIDVIAKYENIMPFVHLPVQSGNDEVLKLMGRKYNAASYKALFDKIKAKIPHVSVSTDIIVGFPNETAEQFEDTLKMVEYCQYDNAYTFIYSPRAGTPAAKMEDNIDLKVKEERLQRLNETVNRYSLAQNKKYLGQIVKVLVEGYSKKGNDMLMGYTDTQKLVNFSGDPKYIGEIVEVEITDAKTWSLNGKICE